jgi:adenylate cyclase
LRAARAIDLALDRLNEKVAAEIGHPVQVSIGIHAGSFVVGRIGLGKTSVVSVVGLGSDIAHQLAVLAPTSSRQILLSIDAARCAGVANLGDRQQLTLASAFGKMETVVAVGFMRGRDIDLPPIVEPPDSVAS